MLELNFTKCTCCWKFAFQGTLTRQVGHSDKNFSSDFRTKIPTHFTGRGRKRLTSCRLDPGREKIYLEGCFGDGSGSEYEFGAYVVCIF